MSSIHLAVLALSMTAAPSDADWPQWRGPNRDGISKETGLLKTWPKGGPTLLWTFEKTGLGYSSFSVVGDVLYTMGAVDEANGNQEFVLAVDHATGKELWRTPIGAFYPNRWGGGPRGTPTLDGDRLYSLGGNGDLACLSRDGGKVVWQKNLKKDFKGQMMSGWGYSESVLIDGDNLICTPGGPEGTIVALSKATGETVWRSTDLKDPAAYASLIVAEVGGVRQYITMTNKGVVGVRARDGKLLWSNPVGANPTAVIPTPVFYKDHVFVTSHYGAGCGLVRLTPDGDGTKAEKVYANKAIMNHHGGVIRVGEYVYGHTDSGGGGWVALEFLKSDKADGPEPASKFRFDKGSAVYADGSMYLFGQSKGEVVKVVPSPDEWTEQGRFTIPKTDPSRSPSGGVWAHPVVAHGKLFLRDQNYLFCYDIQGK